MALSAFAEEYPQSWRAEDDELYDGVMRGLRTTSCHLTVLTESSERRVRVHLYFVRCLMTKLIRRTGSYIGFDQFRGVENTEGSLYCHSRSILPTGPPIR